MNTDVLFSQIQELKRLLVLHEKSIDEMHNLIFLLEEKMFNFDDCKSALQGHENVY
jgi:hypothetical protein